MLNRDQQATAEQFFQTVIAPLKKAAAFDKAHAEARAELANESLKLAMAGLAAGGLDPERLNRLAEERSAKRRKLSEEGDRRAADASAEAARGLLEIAPVILPIEPINTVIDQMLFIRTYADQGSLIDSSVGSFDNWARYRLEGSRDLIPGIGRLSFFALWQNDQDEVAVIMAQPQLVVNARLVCDAEWSGVASWFGMSSVARGKVFARTTVWGMTPGVSSVVHEDEIAANDIEGGFFGDDGAVKIEINRILPATGVVVPANTYVMIEVEIYTEWSTQDGKVVLDAESGSHRIDVPQILVSHVGGSMPPPDPQPGMISLTTIVSDDGGFAGYAVTLSWAGATGARVDIYQNGAKVADTENDGSFSVQVTPGNYTFRVCEANSSVCSTDVAVTVP